MKPAKPSSEYRQQTSNGLSTVKIITTKDDEVSVMAGAAFDQARADNLIQELGSEIIRSPKISDYDWDALAVVIELNPQERAFGYVFWNEDGWEAASPSFDALDKADELRSTMRISGKNPWKKALVQINRASGKINIDFDYSGDKWVPDMIDPKSFAMTLKPAD
jgi:hypothetical protein